MKHERLVWHLCARPALYAAIKYTGVPAGRLQSKDRDQVAFAARRFAWLVMREQGFSLVAIGKATHRDHTTVLSALKNVTPNERTAAAAYAVAGTVAESESQRRQRLHAEHIAKWHKMCEADIMAQRFSRVRCAQVMDLEDAAAEELEAEEDEECELVA